MQISALAPPAQGRDGALAPPTRGRDGSPGERALVAGPGALRALRAGGQGRIELVFARAAYVRLDQDWLVLAERDVSFGPLSLVVDAPLDVSAGSAARVERERLVLGGRTVSLDRVRERRPPRPPRSAGPRAVAEAAAMARAVLPPPPAPLRPGLAALRCGRLRDAVRSLAGLGKGLTPAGDDVLTGYAAWRAAEGRPLEIATSAAGLSSPIGLAYLRCGERGELPDAAAHLLAAIRLGSVPKVESALPALGEWGATSGTALAWGMLVQLDRSFP
jgi:Protein of unknown function (DUF2877)